jgi:hypothetical protein
MREGRTGALVALAVVGLALGGATRARAFCGFYVSGADAELYNRATNVVLMRQGTRTVLSMQNSYEGPPEDFAMVVPVPTVLQEEDVQTLNRAAFTEVDRLASPRLVEYWEQDPCFVDRHPSLAEEADEALMAPRSAAVPRRRARLGVRVEAEFAVGEYDIVILSAEDSSGLDTWLRQEGYRIPAGAEPILRPYVRAGTKFFVARVDVGRVEMADGRAMLSPLRVTYESERFDLPVRLGLVNSAGTQDLLVHILAADRYEAANYANVPVPTNLRVTEAAREDFGAFYLALLDRVRVHDPNAVITEYAWPSSSCDPCPGGSGGLSYQTLAVLGADRLGQPPGGFILTRLHYRYEADDVGEDLVFRAAPPLVGGRGTPDAEGVLPSGEAANGVNQFQGRYAVLHAWDGPIACQNPVRGRWGGPPGGVSPVRTAPPTAFASHTRDLEAYLDAPRPELALPEGAEEAPPPASVSPLPARAGGCASCSAGVDPSAPLALLGLPLLGFWLRRRR